MLIRPRLLIFFLIGLSLIATPSVFAATLPTITAIKTELHHMLGIADPKLWRQRLAPDFKSGFGEAGEGEAAKREFIRQITSDKKFRGEFGTIIVSCEKDGEHSIVCPSAWNYCAEDDYECGSQTRLLIDFSSRSWKISFYGGGD